jgi:hypothetical protein
LRFDPLSSAIDVDALVSWGMHRRAQLRAIGISVALAVFIFGLAWSLRAVPSLGLKFRLGPALTLLVIGAPIGTLINSVELYAISRMAGGPMKWPTSIELTIYSTAANMLPVPGGALTRLAGMKAHGVGLRAGSGMLLLSALLWGGLAFAYSAAALIWLGHTLLAASFLAASGFIAATCILALYKIGHWRLAGVIALLRAISFPLEAVRLVLAASALGSSIGFIQASVFSAASFASAAVVIVPTGLGIRETLVALLAPLALLDPAMGFLIASLDRIVWMAGLALTAGTVLLLTGRAWPVNGGERR